MSIGRPRERAEKVSTHRCAGLWSECAEQEERAVRKGRGVVSLEAGDRPLVEAAMYEKVGINS